MVTEEEDKKLAATIKVWNEYEYFANDEYSNVILYKVNLLLELVNSLAVEKIEIEPWKVWCEPVLYKLSYHISSIVKLFHGTQLPYKMEEKDLIVFDEPSIIILFRTIIENYLTFFYLFGNSENEEVKVFRNMVWRYCGIKQRTKFAPGSEAAKEKQESEKILLSQLKKEITDDILFQKYSKKNAKIILKGKNPRLFHSWKNLISQSDLNSSIFNNLYGSKSNYSHTEFISILQIHMGGYGHIAKSTRSHYFLLIIHCLICRTILEVVQVFPSMKTIYDTKQQILKDEIDSLARICTNANLMM